MVTTESSASGHTHDEAKTEELQIDELLSHRSGVRRHATFWFEDGTVIVTSSDGVEFKVHKSVLTLHSTKFAELIRSTMRVQGMGPVPLRGQDACNITLHLDERGDDLVILFEVFYGKSSLMSHLVPVEFATLRVAGQLAVQYDVRPVVQSVVARLRQRYPSTLDAWLDASNLTPIAMEEDDCIAIVALARICGAEDILPLVFYECCQLSLQAIVDGVSYSGEKVTLSPDDLRLCLIGYSELQRLNINVTKVILDGFTPTIQGGCSNPPHCLFVSRNVTIKCVEDEVFQERACLESLSFGIMTWTKENLKYKFCVGCKKALIAEEWVRRRRAFEELGSIFDADLGPACDLA